MRWVISNPQRHFFQENGYEIFEGFVPAFADDFPEGRDISRLLPAAKKLSYNKDLASVAADLFGKKTLRFAFDQKGLNFLKNTVRENFSIQGLVGGVLLTPSGSALFFDAELPVENLPERSGFMIGYSLSPLYIHNPLDPYNASLKALGYNFGDLLRESTHPTLVRL